MSWAEILKINSNIKEPLNELINKLFNENNEQLNFILSQINNINSITKNIKEYLYSILDSSDLTETIFSMLKKINAEKLNIKQELIKKGVSMNDIPFFNYHNKISSIEIKKPEQSKIITPGNSKITVLPDNGKTLSSVIVNPSPQKGMLRQGIFQYPSTSTFGTRDGSTNYYTASWKNDLNVPEAVLNNAYALYFYAIYYTSNLDSNLTAKKVLGWWIKDGENICGNLDDCNKNGDPSYDYDLDYEKKCYINSWGIYYYRSAHKTTWSYQNRPKLVVIYSDYS